MKGLLFTGIILVLVLALYFKFIHPKVMAAGTPAGATSSYGYDQAA